MPSPHATQIGRGCSIGSIRKLVGGEHLAASCLAPKPKLPEQSHVPTPIKRMYVGLLSSVKAITTWHAGRERS